jgi:hypothetical protein
MQINALRIECSPWRAPFSWDETPDADNIAPSIAPKPQSNQRLFLAYFTSPISESRGGLKNYNERLAKYFCGQREKCVSAWKKDPI